MNLTAISNFLTSASQDVPGVVALAVSPDRVIYEGAFGYANTGTGARLDVATPHAIMSMTKPITSLAIMQLIERGQLELDSPVAALTDKAVLSNVDIIGKTYDLVTQNTPVTVRHLLTHTAGIGYRFCNEVLQAFKPDQDLDFPLLHQPGSHWTYGVSTAVLGNLLEEIYDQPLSEVFEAQIFTPLGLTSTTFRPQTDQVHPHSWDGNSWQAGKHYPEMPYGDGGLISTAADYGKLLQCLLNQGAPLISADTLALMTSNQIGDLTIHTQPAANPRMTEPFPTGDGIDKFGLGFQIHMQSVPGGRNAGSYSWCGLLNTYFWVDPRAQIAAVLLMQVLPLYEARCRATLDGFERALYQSL